MISRLLHKNNDSNILLAFLLTTSICLLLGVISYSILPVLIPIALVGLYITIVDIRLVYFTLIGVLAISTEIELPGGLGTDLPAEPLMLLITFVYFLLLIHKPQNVIVPIKSPITLMILAHVVWIGITAITSENPVVSIKFLLAKIWYVVPFYFAAFAFLENKSHIKKMLWFLLSFVILSTSFVMVKHISLGLTFDTIEQAVQPIFRNHVNYACLLVVTIPYLWFVTYSNRKNKTRLFILLFINALILFAIYLSFTRAAILSVAIGIGAYFVLRWKLTTLAFVLSIFASAYFVNDMVQNNNFMEYAPNFEKTITHKNFDNLLEATAKGEDISTMERVYRWIAGVRMVAERPIVGYGPNNFYPYYKAKTVNAFETYVSDNPEKSGIHCYYLMVPVEQGIPGFILFILLCFIILYQGEKTFHRCKDLFYKYLTAAAYISVIIVLSILLVNDLLEADKVGPFFFLGAALIVLSNRETTNSSTLPQ